MHWPCLKTGPAGAYKLYKIAALAMITKHWHTYASHAGFDSFNFFMEKSCSQSWLDW